MQQNPEMTMSFTPKPVSLKFLLGEYCLYSARFSAVVNHPYFTASPDEAVDAAVLKEQLKSARAAVYYSCPVAAPLPRLTISSDTIRYVPNQYDRYHIVIQGAFDDYLKKFSSKMRSTLRRKVKKFAKFSGGQVDWREYVTPEEMDRFHDLARQIAVKTYQERLLGAALPDSTDFLESMKELAAANRVRAYILFHGETPIAYLYCPVTDGVLSYDYLGYDPACSEWSPGTVLQYLVLEKLFGEGNNLLFDFTEGGGAHKELFATDCAKCADIYYFRASVRNTVMVLLHGLVSGVSRGMVKVTERLGIKSRLKKLIRSKA